jgi:hypothetical protein
MLPPFGEADHFIGHGLNGANVVLDARRVGGGAVTRVARGARKERCGREESPGC